MLWNLSTIDMFTLVVVFGGISYMCGLLTDLILTRAGFGPFGNALLILLGAFAGMYGYNLDGKYLFRNPEQTLMVIGIASFTMLVMMASIKRVIMH